MRYYTMFSLLLLTATKYQCPNESYTTLVLGSGSLVNH